jgi:hypothetical protein
MPDNNLMCQQQFLFMGNVDIEIRILLIEVMDGYEFLTMETGQQCPVGP